MGFEYFFKKDSSKFHKTFREDIIRFITGLESYSGIGEQDEFQNIQGHVFHLGCNHLESYCSDYKAAIVLTDHFVYLVLQLLGNKIIKNDITKLVLFFTKSHNLNIYDSSMEIVSIELLKKDKMIN